MAILPELTESKEPARRSSAARLYLGTARLFGCGRRTRRLVAHNLSKAIAAVLAMTAAPSPPAAIAFRKCLGKQAYVTLFPANSRTRGGGANWDILAAQSLRYHELEA
jgi:hypothetical protein